MLMILTSLPKVGARVAALTASLLLPGTALASGTVHATLVGDTDLNRPVHLAITLPLRDARGAAEFARRVSTPGDALYRHFLTPAQFAARFGASLSDYRLAAAWAKAHGLTPGEEYTAHHVLPVTGRAGDVAAAFGVHFSDYKDPAGHVFYKADAAPRIPSELTGKIDAVLGLHNVGTPVDFLSRLPKGAHLTGGGTSVGGAYGAADLRTAYSVPVQPPEKGGETVAVFEQGGFDPNDVAVYEAKNKLPATKVVARGVDGYGGGIDDPGVELEAVLDIDTIIGINPAVAKIIVYEVGYDEAFAVGLVDSYAAIASDDKAQTISISYGVDEAQQDPNEIQAENTGLAVLVSQGQAVFASAGDNGAYGREGNGLNAPDPGSQPNLTGVGGTTLFTGTEEAYLNEITWNELGSRGFATGGGVSSVWPIPAYQAPGGTGTSVASANGGSVTNRNTPDVAAVGDPFTGVAVYSALNGGWVVGLGGTSLSSPLFAGVESIANATSKVLGFGPIGFANPTLYKVATGATLTFFDFHDIADGSNGDALVYGIPGYFAGYGFDDVTGWGTPVGNDLALDLAAQPALSQSSPPPAVNGLKSKSTSTSVEVIYAKASGASGYAVEGFNLSTGGSYTTVTTGDHATFTGLTPNTVYGFQVLSLSATGYTYSLPLYVTTPK
jgi:kumamolisin